MPDISRLVIEIDSSGFLKASGNGKVFEELLKKIQGESTKTEKSIGSLGKEFSAFQLITNKLPPVLRSAVSGLLGLVSPAHAAVGAFVELTEAAIGFAKGSLEAFSQYELIKTNLELVMGSAESATATLGELRDLAAKTPFSLPGVAQAASMLRQAGVAAGDLVGTIEMLGNVSGGNMERFNRISYNFTQGLQKGVLDARDIREFANNLVPIQQALQAIGVTGTATKDDMVEAFRYMTREGGMFFNAMYRQGDTLIGKMDQWKEAWAAFQATWAETSGLGKLWKEILDRIAKGLQDATGNMTSFTMAQKALRNIASGDASAKDYIDLEAAQKHLSTTQSALTQEQYQFKLLIDQTLASESDMLDVYRQEVELQNQRTAAEEDWKTTVEDSNAKYLDIQNQIQEAYAKTAKGQAEALMKEIAKWRELQKATFWQQKDGEWKLTGINPQEFQQIEEYLKFLEESGKKAKTELSDWQQLLQSTLDVSDQAALSGMTALEEYTTGFYDRLGGALAYAQMAGENAADVYGEFADEIERAMKALMRSGKFNINDASIRGLVELLQRIDYNKIGDEWTKNADNEGQKQLNRILMARATTYDEKLMLSLAQAKVDPSMQRSIADLTYTANYVEEMDYLRRQIELENMTPAEKEKQLLRDRGIPDDKIDEVYKERQKYNDQKYIKPLETQLDLEKQLASGEITRNEYAAQMLAIQQNISIEAARHAIDVQSQISSYQLMRDLLRQMGEASLSSLIDMAHELGEAFRDGKDAGDALSDAFGNMMKRMIDMLPQLLLSAGLQALIAGNVPLGLALIGASGLSAFVSGMISDSERDNAEDQLAKLQKIQDAIASLIDQQKSLEEYYFKRRQELNARAAMNVNDLIVTPQGTWSTHPDDYIIATKSPQTLNSGGGVQMNVKIVNNAGAVVTAQQGIGPDGINEFLIMVDQRIQNNIASGKFDGSFAMRDARTRGRNYRT